MSTRVPTSASKKTPVRKRDHETGASGESLEKKEAKDDASKHIFLVGFTAHEAQKYEGFLAAKNDWAIVETLSDSITHLVIKSLGTLKNSQQLLPIYYAVLKGLWVLKPSFLPTAPSSKKKSLGGPRPLEDEKEHEYDGMEIDANHRAKDGFPSILEVVRIRNHVRDLEETGRLRILEYAPYQKVAILAGRSKESKQRREELKLVMEAGGATVVDESVFKTWKAKGRRGGEVERPSMVVIVNGEMNMRTLGLDDEVIRDLLKARAPLFYEEFIMGVFMYTMTSDLDELLLHSIVFIHEQMKSVDPDGKLMARLLGDDESDNVKTPQLAPKTPSGRRLNSRASSSARESSSSEQIVKKRGKKEKEEGEGEEKETPLKKPVKDQKEEGIVDSPKKGRGRPRKDVKKEVKEEEEDEITKAVKKEIKKKQMEKRLKDVKKEPRETDDVDPALVDGNDDLLTEFEKEIEERNEGGRREERSERELRQLREMMEDRGDGEEEEEGEPPVTPEPIIFSQPDSQPEIEIPEELRRALETREEDEEESQDSGSEGNLVIDEKDSSDTGSDTIVGEGEDDIADMEALREEMNDEMGGGRREEEEERSETPQGVETASAYGLNGGQSSVITIEAAKECETCIHLGSQYLYFNENEQTIAGIEKHFNSPRFEWLDLIVDVRERMPWIQEGKSLRPSCDMTAQSMGRRVIDLFYSFYHEMDDESNMTTLLAEINSSNAMEMYEDEWEEKRARRPPLDLMIKMLHEFSVKRHAEDLAVPERACAALRTTIPVILPSSVAGRHYWLTVIAGGSQGIKGRAAQVVEEMAKRCKTFFVKSLLATDCFLPCVAQFVAYFCEVDLLCAQTPVIDYDLPGKIEEESQSSQRSTRAKKSKRKKNPLENFPLILLLLMELDESPRRGLTESAILVLQKLMENVLIQRRHQEWAHSAILQRALLCLLEAARWHCSMAASSALTGAERRRMKAVESAAQSKDNGSNVPVELQQNVKRVIRMMLKKGYPNLWVRETLALSWLEDLLDSL